MFGIGPGPRSTGRTVAARPPGRSLESLRQASESGGSAIRRRSRNPGFTHDAAGDRLDPSVRRDDVEFQMIVPGMSVFLAIDAPPASAHPILNVAV
ncbi:MAG: hypothetical protein HY943_17100 [Gammaproteobacteria bacterium]|nr:hypothetical protein [Gammaproteobacteria bacterium]